MVSNLLEILPSSLQRVDESDKLDRRRSAYHEAGHALAAYHAKSKIENVKLFGDEEGGITKHQENLNGKDSKKRNTDHIIINFAGAAAEIEVFGTAYTRHCAQDFIEAAWTVTTENPAQSLGTQKACFRIALEFMNKNRPVLDKLANALNKKGHLTGKDVEQILCASPAPS